MFKLYVNGLPEDERCSRALRAMELERVATETRRAGAAFADEHLIVAQSFSLEEIRQRILRSRVAVTVAALNLMGIHTLLPGEEPDGLLDILRADRIYLQKPDDGNESWRLSDSLDVLSGLIGDFRRSTIFINGLRIEPVTPSPSPLMLVASHQAIMVAFGEFLAQKYIVEGWTLG